MCEAGLGRPVLLNRIILTRASSKLFLAVVGINMYCSTCCSSAWLLHQSILFDTASHLLWKRWNVPNWLDSNLHFSGIIRTERGKQLRSNVSWAAQSLLVRIGITTYYYCLTLNKNYIDSKVYQELPPNTYSKLCSNSNKLLIIHN